MKSLLLIGGGGHCRACIDVIESGNQFKVAGIVDRCEIADFPEMGYPLLGNDDYVPGLIERYGLALITVGQIKSADVRVRLFDTARDAGAGFPVIVSPHAYLSRRAEVSAGTILMHGALVNAHARIGENCIINSQALIEHDVVVEAHCHVSTGAKVNGGVLIEKGTFVGSGAVIREGVRIGSHCVIGAGAIVKRDLSSGMVHRDKDG